MKSIKNCKDINIIEPTLFDETGHEYSYVKSIITAESNPSFNYNIWHDKRGGNNLFNIPHVKSKAYFFRKIRKFQKLLLYRKLLKNNEIIYTPTSQLLDLLFVNLFAKNNIKLQNNIILHFHQFKKTDKKLQKLKTLAKSLSNISILTPTAKLTSIFKNAGFKNAITVECPSFVRPDNLGITNKFEKILFAGAARADKGFAHAVNLACGFKRNNINTKFTIQISKPNSNKYDKETEDNINRLKVNRTDNLTLLEDTQSEDNYLNLFINSICLLPYCSKSYNDKFSGVTLDALYTGCPIITTKDTWMGDTVQQYQAGLALDNFEYNTLKTAIDEIIQNFAKFNTNAIKAGQELKKLHHPANTVNNIRDIILTNTTVF